MTPVVVEVGPVTVRGPRSAPPGRAEQAVACVADRLAVVDHRVVEVADLLREVLAEAAGGRRRSLAVVLPSWWSAAREATVAGAAGNVAEEVRVFRRGSLLSAVHDAAVVEVAADVVAIVEPDRPLRVWDRESWPPTTGVPDSAVVDVPCGVVAPPGLPGRRCRREDLEAAVAARTATRARLRFRRPVAAVLAGVLVTAATVPWLARDRAQAQWRVLAEGRAAIEVPTGWGIDRITSGPGSARVRIFAPGGLPALHLTQSIGPTDMAATAETLGRAIALAPAGVFDEFRPDVVVGDRAAVTYRERRAGSQTEWAVIVDKDVRIAIGCQSAPARAEAVAQICARAVSSAHAIG